MRVWPKGRAWAESEPGLRLGRGLVRFQEPCTEWNQETLAQVKMGVAGLDGRGSTSRGGANLEALKGLNTGTGHVKEVVRGERKWGGEGD